MIRIVRSKTLGKMRDKTARLRDDLTVSRRAAAAQYDEADYQARVAQQAKEDPRVVESRVFGQVAARLKEPEPGE